MTATKNNFSSVDVWALMAILLLGFALYICPLKSKSFCFDDRVSVLNDAVIKQIDIPKIFNAFNTRSLVGLSFALNYKWTALNPGGYRLINLVIHCLNAFLVYLLIKSTLCLYASRKPILFCRLEWVAFLGSLLFLSHPIQTEPVNFITQRFVLMGTFFYLLTLFLYIQYRCRFQKRYLIASLGSGIAAMFCKEFVVTLPVMLFLYDFYFLDALAETWWKRCSRIFPFFVIVLIVPILLLRTPHEAIGVASIAESKSHVDITRAYGSIGRGQYFLTELNVVRTYVRLLFLPINQNLDYDYPISNEIDNKTVLSGLFLLCLLIVAAVTYKSCRVVSFSILWFFIALSVESSFIPIGHVIAEYRLYLASVGFVFLVMSLMYIKQEHQKKIFLMGVAILIGFSLLTYQRNKVWNNDLALWDDTVHKSPHKARPYLNRGMNYYKRGEFTKAIFDFNKAIEIDPKFAGAYHDRGLIYDSQGQIAQALSDYNKAIELNPSDADVFNNRSIIYANQGKFILAVADLNKVIELKPNNAESYSNRGSLYAQQGEYMAAMSNYNKAIEIDPEYADAYNNRLEVYKALMQKSKN